MSRSLDDLKQPFYYYALVLISRCAEHGIPVFITSTGRTQDEQDEFVAQGKSKVSHSKHQDGLAIDICPYQQYNLHGSNKLNWDAKDQVWQEIGKISEKIGLRWGGRFGESAPGKGDGWDPSHHEILSRAATLTPTPDSSIVTP